MKEGGQGEGRGESREQREESRRGQSFFINTDDTFIQAAHQRPSSQPIIKHYATLRTHAPRALVPDFLESARLFSSSVRLLFYFLSGASAAILNVTQSGGLSADLKRENWVTAGHSCSQFSLSRLLRNEFLSQKKKVQHCLFLTERDVWNGSVAVLETAVGTDD